MTAPAPRSAASQAKQSDCDDHLSRLLLPREGQQLDRSTFRLTRPLSPDHDASDERTQSASPAASSAETQHKMMTTRSISTTEARARSGCVMAI